MVVILYILICTSVIFMFILINLATYAVILGKFILKIDHTHCLLFSVFRLLPCFLILSIFGVIHYNNKTTSTVSRNFSFDCMSSIPTKNGISIKLLRFNWKHGGVNLTQYISLYIQLFSCDTSNSWDLIPSKLFEC